MKKLGLVLLFGLLMAYATGCSTSNVNVSKLKLGMTPDEVIKQIGKPYTIRAAKVYVDNEWTELWEYLPPVFTWHPKTYWIFFENGKVVQWGEPGDFSTGTEKAAGEYSGQKKVR